MILDARGFTVVEILLATAVISVALVGVLAAVPVAMFGVQEGKQLSTATFLAEQRLEQVRNAAWTAAAGGDCLGISASVTVSPTIPVGATCNSGAGVLNAGTVTFPDESTTQINGFNGYSRTVRVTNCGVAPGCAGITDPTLRLVTATVTYTPSSGRGGSPTQKSAVVTLMVARH